MRFKMADGKREIRCYRCGKKVRDGGVGDFNLELKYVTSVRLDAEVSSGRRIRDCISQSRSKNPYGHLQFRNLDE